MSTHIVFEDDDRLKILKSHISNAKTNQIKKPYGLEQYIFLVKLRAVKSDDSNRYKTTTANGEIRTSLPTLLSFGRGHSMHYALFKHFAAGTDSISTLPIFVRVCGTHPVNMSIRQTFI